MTAMAPTRCPACSDGMKGPGKYLCWGCWTGLSMAARRELKRRGPHAMARLQELYRQITAGVPLAEIHIANTPKDRHMTSLNIPTTTGTVTVEATEAAPGLLVFEIPADRKPDATHRWLLAHHEGRIFAAFETQASAVKGAEVIAPLTDWTRSSMTTANYISLSLDGGPQALLQLLIDAGGQDPNA